MFSFLHHPGLSCAHSISKAEHHAKRAPVTGGEITTMYQVVGFSERRPSKRVQEDATESPRHRDKAAFGTKNPESSTSCWHEYAHVDSDTRPSLI